MPTLLDDQFAPITSKIGFLEIPLAEAASGLATWRRRLYGEVAVSAANEGFPEVLHRLEPLTGGSRPRELLISAHRWTAYFDNSLRGTDAVSAIGYLSRAMRCRGLAITAIPHAVQGNGKGPGRMGSMQFELFGPEQTEFLNYLRTVAVAFDGRKWVFHAFGPALPFEEVDNYRQRQVRERLTSEMLERYCRALGIDVLNPDAYGPDAVFFESPIPSAPDGLVMTLEQVQRWLGIASSKALSAWRRAE